jgi:hypothetical protein
MFSRNAEWTILVDPVRANLPRDFNALRESTRMRRKGYS